MLEAVQHGDNTFATLTYDEEHYPNDHSVHPKELSGFIKRLRKRGYKFRFFGVGEYGDDTQRPHYHVILFGFPTCYWINTRKKDQCCANCETIKSAWGKGHIFLGTAERSSFDYIARYVNKKMTGDKDERLEGRRPEFARMSLRPGIGYSAMHEVASELLSIDYNLPDVPTVLAHGKRNMPLGRYLRRNLRKMMGRDEKAPPQEQTWLLPVRVSAFQNSKSFKTAILEASEGRRIQIEATYKRKSGRRSL